MDLEWVYGILIVMDHFYVIPICSYEGKWSFIQMMKFDKDFGVWGKYTVFIWRKKPKPKQKMWLMQLKNWIFSFI
jgi:hypothetical protein